jgi:hypothetical protein
MQARNLQGKKKEPGLVDLDELSVPVVEDLGRNGQGG